MYPLQLPECDFLILKIFKCIIYYFYMLLQFKTKKIKLDFCFLWQVAFYIKNPICQGAKILKFKIRLRNLQENGARPQNILFCCLKLCRAQTKTYFVCIFILRATTPLWQNELYGVGFEAYNKSATKFQCWYVLFKIVDGDF